MRRAIAVGTRYSADFPDRRRLRPIMLYPAYRRCGTGVPCVLRVCLYYVSTSLYNLQCWGLHTRSFLMPQYQSFDLPHNKRGKRLARRKLCCVLELCRFVIQKLT